MDETCDLGTMSMYRDIMSTGNGFISTPPPTKREA